MKVSSVGSYSGSMRLKSSCGNYGETTYQSVHAVPKRKYGYEPSFFFVMQSTVLRPPDGF